MSIKRQYVPWTQWECYKSGFFTPAETSDTLMRWRSQYVQLLSDLKAFRSAMERVLVEWPESTRHNLTNDSMNRVAWLGQASCCITFGACAEQTRSAFNLLTQKKQDAANACADNFLQEYLRLMLLFGEVY